MVKLRVRTCLFIASCIQWLNTKVGQEAASKRGYNPGLILGVGHVLRHVGIVRRRLVCILRYVRVISCCRILLNRSIHILMHMPMLIQDFLIGIRYAREHAQAHHETYQQRQAPPA